MRCRNSVLLPEPLPPMMTKISAGLTTKLTFFWITKPPYAMSRLATSMRGRAVWAELWAGGAIIAASLPEYVEDDTQQAVGDDDEHDRGDHRRGRGQSHRRGAPTGLHPAKASRHGDQDPEHRRTDESHAEVARRDHVNDPDDVRRDREVQHRDGNQTAARDAEQVGVDREQRRHQHERQ